MGEAMYRDNVPLALTFDDVLLVPRESDVLPAQVSLELVLAPYLRLSVPFLSSAMDTVTESDLAIALARVGGVGVIHKNLPIHRQAEEVRRVKVVIAESQRSAVDASGRLLCGAAVGVGEGFLDRAAALVEAGVDFLVVDSAHGHSRRVLGAASKLKINFAKLPLVIGNVATPEGAMAGIDAGADVIKVGIGPGSICTTRIIAGVGVPQLTAVGRCAEVVHRAGKTLIADGGVKTSGDVAKAIAAGADAVMLGSLFAGTDEAPGEVITFEGLNWKIYRGMGSLDAMRAGSADRYFQDAASSSVDRKLVAEGVVGRVPSKGPLVGVVAQLVGGLRAAMGYCGCPDIAAMQRDAEFVRITPAGLRESHVHDVVLLERPLNYPF